MNNQRSARFQLKSTKESRFKQASAESDRRLKRFALKSRYGHNRQSTNRWLAKLEKETS